MTRRHFLRCAATGAAMVGVSNWFPDVFAQDQRAAGANRTKRPNIFFFFVDDMGWKDTSLPFGKETTELNERYRTPLMEKLAREGVKFIRAYAAAICSPTRNSIMSGQNSARHRVTTWTRDLNQIHCPTGEGRPLDPPDDWNFNALRPTGTSLNNSFEAETLPRLLSYARYRTIHVRKAHLGTNYSLGEYPMSIGFDDNVSS